MRKIYSLVLMTAMLFVGANAWAVTRTASNASEFEAAWTAAQNNDVIQLTNDVTVTSKIFWLGTANMNDAAKSLTLDLNGHVLTQTGDDVKYMFVITHGELNVTTSVPGVGQIIQNGANNEALFHLTGSSYKNVNAKTAESGYYTHLTIAEGVTVDAKVVNAIVVDEIENSNFWNAKYAKASLIVATAGTTAPTAMPYTTRIFYDKPTDQGGTIKRGLANGVRVDLHGIIRGNKYAIKANGNLAGPANPIMSDLTGVWANPEQTIQYAKADGDENFSPFIRIYGTADLRVPASNNAAKKPVAVYCSGYARWLIEGTCIGSTGVYVKSGDVDINDATIQSNYTGNYTPASATNSGVTASGSAIVMESNAAYAGDIDVTISGDTKVEATNGYAIDEAVTNADNTKVDAITITGGTFDGGNVGTKENPQEGTIKVTETTVNNTSTTVTVNGGTVTGTGENNVNIGGQDLAQYLADQSTNTHITYVEDAEGHTTMVISEGGAPDATTTVSGATANTSVTWKTETVSDAAMVDVIASDLALDELVINDTTTTGAAKSQTLTINAGKTLEVKRVILGAGAQIVVEAGAKFLVTGDQGITANYVDNIRLKATADAQATFVIKGNVKSNRQPKATVEFTTNAKQETASSWKWQRFTTPILTTTAPNNNAPAAGENYWNNTGLVTYVDYMDDATTSWQHMTKWSQMRVFGACAITNNMKPNTDDVTYTFTGQLVGNVTDSINLKDSRWNYFGNSYMAPMGTQSLLAAIQQMPSMDQTVYLWKMENQTYATINSLVINMLEGIANGNDSIPTMGFFIVKNLNSTHRKFDINYDKTIYGYATGEAPSPVSAPARVMSNMNVVRIDIVSENGRKDNVYVVDGGDFTAEYESGMDAEKFMADNSLNIYAAGEDMNYSILATDDMLGTIISLQTTEDINYTLSFNNVRGEIYALRDNLTNTVVLMNEGAIYNFTAQPNATLDGRFQIVSRQEMPTAVETIEETVAPKAIYTIMGQYVGETTDWNTLPAGVYVVDGVKVIK